MKDYFFIKQKKLMLQEAFCIAVAIIIAMIIEISFNFKNLHGYWIPMTVAVMFINPSQGSMIKRSSDRILGTFLGLVFGFLYVKILMFSDYRWGYLLPIISVSFVLCKWDHRKLLLYRNCCNDVSPDYCCSSLSFSFCCRCYFNNKIGIYRHWSNDCFTL